MKHKSPICCDKPMELKTTSVALGSVNNYIFQCNLCGSFVHTNRDGVEK